MDTKTIIRWVVAAAVRLAAGAVAGKLAIDAAQSAELQTQVVDAVVALVLIGISLYTSYAGRAKLLAAEPPK